MELPEKDGEFSGMTDTELEEELLEMEKERKVTGFIDVTLKNDIFKELNKRKMGKIDFEEQLWSSITEYKTNKSPPPCNINKSDEEGVYLGDLIKELDDDVENNRLKLCGSMYGSDKVVFGRGNKDSKIMVIAEAPGQEESLSGLPLIGPSGKLLEKELFEENGLSTEDDTYVSNIVRIFPYSQRYGGDRRRPRQPTALEIKSHLPHLKKLIQRIQPRVIYCFGKIAANVLCSDLKLEKLTGYDNYDSMPFLEPIGRLQNKIRTAFIDGVDKGVYIVPLWHPSYILRSEDEKQKSFRLKLWKKKFKESLDYWNKEQIAKPIPMKLSDLNSGWDKSKDPNFKWDKADQIFWERPDPPVYDEIYKDENTDGKFLFEIMTLDHLPKENKFRAFGRTQEGHSVQCIIEGFKFHFFTEIPLKYKSIRRHTHLINSITREISGLLKEENCDINFDVQMEAHDSMYGYRCIYEEMPYFVRINVEQHWNIKKILNLLKEEWGKETIFYKDSEGEELSKPVKKKILMNFETDVPPDNRFTYDTKIKACSWVEIPNKSVYKVTGLRGDLFLDKHRKTETDIEIEVHVDDLIYHDPSNEDWCHHAPQRIVSFDIEMLNEKLKFPTPDKDPIICICNELQVQTDDIKIDPKSGQVAENHVYSFTLRKCKEETNPRKHLFQFDDELEMIIAWRNFIIQVDPDILLGHNIKGFDLKVIYQRMEFLRATKERGWNHIGRVKDIKPKIEEKKFSSRAFGERTIVDVPTPGRCILDTLEIYLREKKLSSYKLDYIASKYLGMTKNDMPYVAIPGFFWGTEDNVDELRLYCDKDASLPLCLVNNGKWLYGLWEFARINGSVFPDGIYTRGQQIKVFSCIMHENMKNGRRYIVPTHERISESDVPEEIVENYTMVGGIRDDGDGDDFDEDDEEEAPSDTTENKSSTKTLDGFVKVVKQDNAFNKTSESSNPSPKDVQPTTDTATATTATSIPTDKPPPQKKYKNISLFESFKRGGINIIPKDKEEPEYHIPTPKTLKRKRDENDENNIKVYVDVKKRKTKKAEKKAGYKGATVITPVKGFHKRPVLCGDFKSLYPSIHITYNISHDCKLFECEIAKKGFDPNNTERDLHCAPELFKHKGCEICGDKDVKVYYVKQEYLLTVYESDIETLVNTTGLNPDEDLIDTGRVELHSYKYRDHIFQDENDAESKKEKVYMFKDKTKGMGIICKALVKLLTARGFAKKDRDKNPPGSSLYSIYDGRQLALKIMANSIYGATGVKVGRIADNHLGASVTAWGRKSIEETRDRSLDYYTKGCWADLTHGDVKDTRCVGGDTDSWFGQFAFIDNVEQAMEFGPRYCAYQNLFFTMPMELDFEKVMWPMLVIAKKRYTCNLFAGEFNSFIFEKKRWIELYVDKTYWKEIFSIPKWWDSEKVFETDKWAHCFGKISEKQDGKKISEWVNSEWWKRLGPEGKRRLKQTDEEWIEDYKKPRYKGPEFNIPDYGKLFSRGIETVRRDACPFVATTMQNCLKMVMKEGRIEDAIMYVYNRLVSLAEGKIHDVELVMSKQIRKEKYETCTLPHTYLAKKMKDRDEEPPKLGERVPYYILKGRKNLIAYDPKKGKNVFMKEEKMYMRAETPDHVHKHNLQIDYNYIIKNKCEKPLSKIINPIMGCDTSMLFNINILTRKRKQLRSRTEISDILKYSNKIQKCIICNTLSETDKKICDSCLNNSNPKLLKKCKEHCNNKLQQTVNKYKKQMEICIKCTNTESSPCNSFMCNNYAPRRKLEGKLEKMKPIVKDIENLIDSRIY